MKRSCIGLAAGLALIVGCSDELPPVPVGPDGGESIAADVVYTERILGSTKEGDMQIVVQHRDGSGRRVVDRGIVAGRAGLGRIAFERNDSIFVGTMQGDSWTVTNIPIPESDPDVNFGSVALSPDGRLITFSTVELLDNWEYRFRTYLALADGSSASTPLPVGVARESTPVFSADGRKLAFYGATTDADFKSGDPVYLWVYNTDGSDFRAVATLDRAENDASMWLDFSPDGTQIVYQEPMSSSVFIVNADGNGTPRKIAQPATYPSWTSDGRIMYIGGAGADIILMNADGSGHAQNLTNTETQLELYPQLSPDGRYVVYTGYAGVPDEVPGNLKVLEIANTSNVVTLDDDAYKGFWMRTGR